jgi:hypothetical protein
MALSGYHLSQVYNETDGNNSRDSNSRDHRSYPFEIIDGSCLLFESHLSVVCLAHHSLMQGSIQSLRIAF